MVICSEPKVFEPVLVDAAPPPVLEHVFAAPVVTRAGDVYVGTQGLGLVALDANGGERWRVELAGDVDGAPAIGFDGMIYVGDDGGRVTAIRPTGTVLWSVPVGGSVRSAITLDVSGALGVRVLSDDNVVSFLTVTIVDDTSRGLAIAGIEPGTRIIVSGQDMVSDGQTVDAVPADDVAAGTAAAPAAEGAN